MIIRLFLLFFFMSSAVFSQHRPLDTIMAKIESHQKQFSREKLFLHLDKATYTSGDTIWLKAYLLDAAFMTASKQSGVVHLELINDTGKVIVRRLMEIKEGLGSGSIAVRPADIPDGTYTLRGYTNLMRNFGPEADYFKSLYISGRSQTDMLVSSQAVLQTVGSRDSISVALRFRRLDNSVTTDRNVQLRVTDGRKTYFRDGVRTDSTGKVVVNFVLPEGVNAGKVVVVATEDSKSTTKPALRIPLDINRIDQIDLQFKPEGGHLVAGLPVRVGFKALSENGSGTNVSGAVYNRREEKVASFSTSHRGMGSFELQTQPGEKYTARINGSERIWPLPEVQAAGTSLRVINKQETDSVDVFVTFSAGHGSFGEHYLIGQYNGIVCYAGAIKGNTRLRIAKALFSTGIARFTLLNQDSQPLNERIVFINRHDELTVSINPSKPSYGPRDSVNLDLKVTDKEGNPVQGSFSVSVTDDHQVKTDGQSGNTIRAHMLLTADLKGTVEHPGYYLINGPENWTNLDNLLLTQAWIGYDWKEYPILTYKSEPEFAVKGRVVNVVGKPLYGTAVRLLIPKPFFVADQTTDSAGLFTFNNFPSLDSTVLFRLQAKNLKGKNFNVGIELQEDAKPGYPPDKYTTAPWYVNSDSLLINRIKRVIEEEQGTINLPKSVRVLDEVTVRATKVIPRSKNLNGQGISDFAMNENEIVGSGKMNLMQLIQQKVPKFFTKYFPPPVKEYFYTINGARVFIVIDGIPLDYFYTPQYCGNELCPRDYMDFQTRFLEYFTTEDVIGFEVMNWGKNSYRYTAEFPRDNSVVRSLNGLNGQVLIKTTSQPAYSWIEITTRTGVGPQFRSEPGSYVYRPPAFISKKEFYRPRYASPNTITLPDTRATIHWEPWITTDEKGHARLSFYTSDAKGTYSIDMHGTDLNGHFASSTGKINVN